VVAAYFAIFFLLFCYTKRVSHSQFAYNSIFMFISGYSIIFFTLFYFIMSILCLAASEVADDNDVNNSTLDDYSSGLLVLFEFMVFGEFLRIAGISILFMLHHRKVNNSMIWIVCGVYYGPLLFYLIGFLAKTPPILEYPSFLFDLATIGLGSFFYYQYANQNVSSTPLTGSLYEMQA
jgi:hypothetical protein